MSDTSISLNPLSTRTILVVCSAKKMGELVSGIEAMGGRALPFPVIEAQEIDDKHLLDEALASLHEYAWIIFTSAYGVTFFMQRFNELKIGAGNKSMPKICAIGPATARTVKEFGYDVELIPQNYVAEGVIEALEDYHGGLQSLAGQRILIPRAKEAREVLPEALKSAGARVDVAPCYQTVRADPDETILRQLRNRAPDLMVFASSSAIRHLIDILGLEEGKRMLLESTVAVIGPVTFSTAESFGKRPEIVPQQNTIDSLLQAIRKYYECRPAAESRQA